MAAILEMPQYVACQTNLYFFIELSSRSHSFNILCTMDGLAALLTHVHRSRQLFLIAIVGKCVCGGGGCFFNYFLVLNFKECNITFCFIFTSLGVLEN